MPNAPPSASKELVLGQSASRLSLGVSKQVQYHWLQVSSPGTMVLLVLWYYAMDGAVGHPKHRTISSSQAGNAAAGRTEICPGKPVLDRVRLGGTGRTGNCSTFTIRDVEVITG